MNVSNMMISININHTQRYVLGAFAVLAALVCCTFGYSLWQWRNDWILAHKEQTSAAIVKSDQTAVMIAAIPDEHLFGKAFTRLGEAPVTNLQLRVTGIVKVESEVYGSYSKAYISISGQPGKIYQVGDSLPYGVTVYAITPDAVILENDGRIEKLPLPREPLQFKPKPNEERM